MNEEEILKLYQVGTSIQKLIEMPSAKLVKEHNGRRGVVAHRAAARRLGAERLYVGDTSWLLVEGDEEAVKLCNEIDDALTFDDNVYTALSMLRA